MIGCINFNFIQSITILLLVNSQYSKMGNSEMQSPLEKISPFFKETEKFEHPNLGNLVRVEANKSAKISASQNKFSGWLDQLKRNKVLIMRETKENMKEKWEGAIQKWKKRKKISNKKGAKNILKLIDLFSDSQDNICGITYFCFCFYENFDLTLNQMLLTRKNRNQYFSEQQIVHFLSSICHGLIFLNDYSLKNFSLSSNSIVYSAQQNNYKILDTQICKQLHPYMKLLNGIPIEEGTYLSPELVEELIQKNQQPDALYSPKSDIFTLGVLLLQVCTLTQMNSFYTYDKLLIDVNGLRKKVDGINYSQNLKSLINDMLQICEDDRIGLLSLKQKLSSFDDASSNTRVPHGSQFERDARSSNITNFTQKTVKGNYNQTPQTQHYYRIPPNISFHPIPSSTNLVHPNTMQYNPAYQNYETHNQGNNNLNPQYSRPTTHRPFSPKARQTVPQQRIDYRNRAISFDIQGPTENRYYHHMMPLPQPSSESKYFPAETLPTREFQQNNKHLITFNAEEERKLENNRLTLDDNGNKNEEKSTLIKKSNEPLHLASIESSWNEKNNVITSIETIPFHHEAPQNKPIIQPPYNADSPEIKSKGKNKQQVESPFNQQSFSSGQNTPIRKIQSLSDTSNLKRNTFVEILNQISEEDRSENEDHCQGLPPITYGKHNFTNGANYEGQFDAKGNFSGNGILYYPNGKICYSGNWSNNCFNGFGALYNEYSYVSQFSTPTDYEDFSKNGQNSWERYEGEFRMDKKNGFGTLYMKNRDKFCGSFVEDVIEGYGTFTSSEGKIVSGLWSNNVLKRI